MRKGSSKLVLYFLMLVISSGILVFQSNPVYATSYDTELIINGGAETGDFSGWTPPDGGGFVVMDPVFEGLTPSPNGGYVFDFYFGAPGTASISQTIDISDLSQDIDSENVSFTLTGYLRKITNTGSTNALKIELLGSSNNLLNSHQEPGTNNAEQWEHKIIMDTISTGTRSLRITLEGNITAEGASFDYIDFDGISLVLSKIDSTPPAAPVITRIYNDYGPSDLDGITKDQTLMFEGTAEANSTVEVFINAVSIGTTTTDASGDWSYDHRGTSLSPGTYAITATATDAFGNKSGLSSSFSVTIDVTAPVPPVIASISNDTGVSSNDRITNDTTLVFSGTAEPNSYVELFDDMYNSLGLTQADGNGDWYLDLTGSPLSEGNYSFIARATDIAGNQSDLSGTFTVTMDLTAPSGYSLSVDQSLINSTNGTSFLFDLSGAEVGATYNYSINSSGGGTPVFGIGTIASVHEQFGIDISELNDGTLTLSVKLTDIAGNAGIVETNTTIKDTTAPSGYSISFDNDAMNGTEPSSISFTFAGAEVGATYNYTISSSGGGTNVVGSGTIAAATDQINGIDVSGLGDGTLTLSVTLTDSADNTGWAATDTATKDTVLPGINALTNNDADNLVKAGDTVTITAEFSEAMAGTPTITISNGDVAGAAMTNSGDSRTWTFDWLVPAGDNTTATASVTGTDIAGNAYPGGDSISFTIQSSNADLNGLLVSHGSLSPIFASGTTSYNLSVNNETTSITVTPTAAQADATITVNGVRVASGNASNPINLDVGNNTVTISVTAQDGTTTKAYTMTVNRALSNNANLSSLGISSGSLSPTFNSGVINYNVSVVNTVTSVTVTPTTAEANATITVNGTPVASGHASNPISLSVGNNTITITVTAQDGVTMTTYTITVNRTLSGNADLRELVMSAGPLSPTFASETTSYNTSVANDVTSITATPTVDEAHATVTVNGTPVISGAASNPVNLNVGNNTITITVTAQSGTTKTYTVIVNRGLSTNANLSELTISDVTLSPAFASGTTSYTASVVNSVTSITVIPTVEQANATVTVNGTAVTSGNASGAINLSVGDNTIPVIVTAQDGTTTKTYTITVNRAPSSNANLNGLTVSSGPLSPAFASGTTSYNASVANSVTSITITPTAAEANATVTVNGTAVTNGNASSAINLNVGDNTITVTVTAQDGTTIKTYTITVNRALSSNANLGGLTVSSGSLNPVFAPETIDYSVRVASDIAKFTVTPTAAEDNATFTVNEISVANGEASQEIDLVPGDNELTILVTAQDGTTQKTYTLTVNRAVPDLKTTITRSGDLVQGKVGLDYQVDVSNIGTGSSNGQVSVNINIPSGLTVTSITGDGWTITSANSGATVRTKAIKSMTASSSYTATRDDALEPGASYPPIIVTVDVDKNAPTEVSLSSDVSGGGEVDSGNNVAEDPAPVDTDLTGPTVNFIQPLNGDEVNISTGSMVIVEITDNGSGVNKQSIELQLDNGAWISPTAFTNNRMYLLLNTSLSKGEHTISIRAADNYGNETIETITFTWDNYRRGFGFGRFRF